jgi:hypothetical protein
MSKEFDDQESEEMDPEKAVEHVGSWFDAFAKSPRFDQLTEEQKDDAWNVISFFTQYSVDYFSTPPKDWTPATVKNCCLDILPRKVSAQTPFYQAVAPVLSAFFYYLDDQKLIKRAAALAKTVAPLGPQIVAQADNPSNWGMAKSFMMQAINEGVDVSNQKALDAYILKTNRQMQAHRPVAEPIAPDPPQKVEAPKTPKPIQREQPKVGRNDPCPCGSGKKYKKCCGAQ